MNVPYGSSMQQGNGSATPTIRAGLTVQELKQMTAMRMAQTTERSMPNNRITSMDPSSYQTATPEQLQAAGIPPIVINDRVPDRRVMMQRQLSQPLDDRFHSNGYVSSRSPVYANQQNGLSVYHQQLLGTRIPPVRTVEDLKEMTRQRLEQQSRSSHSTGYSPKQQTTPNAVDGSDNLQYGSSHLSYRQQQLLVEHQKYSAAPNVNYPRQPYVDSLTSHHWSENTDSLSSILDQQRGNRHEVPVGLLSVSRSPSNENSFYRNAEQDPVYVPTMDRRSTLARSSSTSILPPHMSGMLNRLDIRESSKMQNSRSPSGYTGIPPLSPTTNEGSPTGMAQIISSSSIGKLPTNLGSPTSFYGPKVVQHTTPKGSASALPNVYQPQINCYPDADNMVRLNDDTNDMFSIGSQDSHPHKYSIPYGNFSDNISINSADTRYSASYASPGPMEKHLDQLRREQANPSPKLLSKKGMFPLVRSKTMGAGIVILEDEPPIQRQFNPFTSLSPLRGHHNGGRAVFFDESDASSTVAQPPLGDANEGYPLNSFCQAHVDNSDLHSEAFSVQAEADAHSVHDDSDDIDDLLYQTITY